MLARSFERIHAANLLNFGTAPLTFKNPADYSGIRAGDKLACADWRDAATLGKLVTLRNKRTGASIECVCALSARQRAVLAAGGLLNRTTSNSTNSSGIAAF